MTTRSEAHTCHAEGCRVKVPPRLFMCRGHWRMVPYRLRVAIWATYQPGQERLDGTAYPTGEYLEVTREAIEAVARKEGRRSEYVVEASVDVATDPDDALAITAVLDRALGDDLHDSSEKRKRMTSNQQDDRSMSRRALDPKAQLDRYEKLLGSLPAWMQIVAAEQLRSKSGTAW